MRTLVLGASLKSERYSNKAIRMLREGGYDTTAHGLRAGVVVDVDIQTELPDEEFHTVTLYLNAQRQAAFEDYIVKLNPARVIFNPGTENPSFQERLRQAGIEPIEACTLVMLSTGQF